LETPDEETPNLIAFWIFRKCEKPNQDVPGSALCEGASFSQALKMRAAISYHYAQYPSRGSEKWHQDHQGVWLGNPALSHSVSRYMISLQRRKVSTNGMYNLIIKLMLVISEPALDKYHLLFKFRESYSNN